MSAATERFHKVTDVVNVMGSLLGYGIVVASATETALFGNSNEADMPYETVVEAVAVARTLLTETSTMTTEPIRAHIVEIRHLTVVTA